MFILPLEADRQKSVIEAHRQELQVTLNFYQHQLQLAAESHELADLAVEKEAIISKL